jgi:hypothetical protein
MDSETSGNMLRAFVCFLVLPPVPLTAQPASDQFVVHSSHHGGVVSPRRNSA